MEHIVRFLGFIALTTIHDLDETSEQCLLRQLAKDGDLYYCCYGARSLLAIFLDGP